MKTELALSIKKETIESLNETVKNALTVGQLEAFDRAFGMANAIQQMKDLLTQEVMKPIMALQGSQLGFKTDKDKNGGYDLETVKGCMITATLMGVMPVGNQFNIIAGNTYITKEGFEFLLKNIQGLDYTVTHDLPRIQGDKAALNMTIEWTYKGVSGKQTIEFPIKTNAYMGADGVIGKGKRKAYAWLYSRVTGVSYTDGDVDDQKATVVSSKIHGEKERVLMLIENSNDLEKFEEMLKTVGDDLKEELSYEIAEKREILTPSSNEN